MIRILDFKKESITDGTRERTSLIYINRKENEEKGEKEH